MQCPKCYEQFDPSAGWLDLWDKKGVRSKAENYVYMCSKNHRKIQRATKLIELAKRLEREVEVEAVEASKLIPTEYSYSVKVDNQKPTKWTKFEGEYIIITATLSEESQRARFEFLERFGSFRCFFDSEYIKTSVCYYRKYNMLFHDRGGWNLLLDEQPCSDEEWEELKKGNISAKFLR